MEWLVNMLGIDREQLAQQSANLTATVEFVVKSLESHSRKLDAILGNQHAIMVQLGLEIPPPSGATLALIEQQSAAVVQLHGGLASADNDPFAGNPANRGLANRA